MVLLASCVQASGESPGSSGAKVVQVFDGDTILVKLDATGKREKVRFIAIDCPEAHRNEKFERDIKKPGALNPDDMLRLGKEARGFVDGFAGPGTKLRLEFDSDERDRYGRLLAYVWVDSGGKPVMLNEELLSRGLAYAVDYGQNHRHLERFRKIETVARKSRVGVWRK
jgi:micrococcal nuclease